MAGRRRFTARPWSRARWNRLRRQDNLEPHSGQNIARSAGRSIRPLPVQREVAWTRRCFRTVLCIRAADHCEAELLGRVADIRDIRDLLGHESVATTEIYTHVSAARRRRVVQLLDAPGDI